MTQVRKTAMMGDEAVAYAVKQADVDVVAAYPITPQTIIVERLSEYVADGELNASFIQAESEHSAISICVGASLAGARVFTSTASQGLALMHEILHAASSMRAPMVMAIANRALNSPLNIHCDHSDVMNARDTGWIHLFATDVQEAYDLTLMAFRLGEDRRILLPVSVNLDGFILSHSVEPLEVLPDHEVPEFLPPKDYPYAIDPSRPATYGAMALPDTYMEFRLQLHEALQKVPSVWGEVSRSFEEVSGRRYSMVKSFAVDGSDAVVVALGSTYGTLKHVAKRLRDEGLRVGVASLTMYRPFPEDVLAGMLGDVKAVVVMDRAYSYGGLGGPLYTDILSTLYRNGVEIPVLNVVYGLGGRDFTVRDAEEVLRMAAEGAERGGFPEKVVWWGVRR